MKETTLTFIAQSPTPTQTQSSVTASQPTPTGIDWITIIVGVGAGVLTGALAAFIAPWAQWNFADWRKKRFDNRCLFINSLREIVSNEPILHVLREPLFICLKQQFSPQEIKELTEKEKKFYAGWKEFEDAVQKHVIKDDLKKVYTGAAAGFTPRLKFKARQFCLYDEDALLDRLEIEEEMRIFLFERIDQLENKWGMK